MIAIFSYDNYKEYVRDIIASKPHNGRGVRALFARALGCQMAYISQVLNGSAHFSLEQAETLSRFLWHTDQEGHFFLLLVQYSRSGTKTLQTYFLRQMEHIRKDRLILKNRLEIEEHLSERNQTIYYSAWYYVAIHVMLSISKFQTKEPIADYLGLPPGLVSRVLDFLVSVGLAKNDGGRFLISTTRIHLGSDSSLISRHHMNWRIRAINAIDKKSNEDLHYSSVVSLSNKDIGKIKALLIEQIQNVKEEIRVSSEEEVYSFCLDFFRVEK